MRRASKAALATIERGSGHPYASLVAVATEPDGSPITLLSRLALHTRNLEADPRASLLVDGTGEDANPLAGGRVTLVGTLRPAASATAARRFLARHAAAADYAGLGDFAYFALELERAHYVGGFGRIATLARDDLRVDLGEARDLVEQEESLLATINTGRMAELGRLARRLGAGGEGPWRAVAVDPAGIDLLAAGRGAARADFARRVSTPAEALRELERLLAGGAGG